MKWRSGLLFCAWAVLSPATISLQPTTATADAGTFRDNVQELLAWCKKPTGSPEFWYCMGFINGVGQLLLAIGPEHLYGICTDNDLPQLPAMVQAFRNWAEQNPRHWDKPALTGVNVALSLTWPCAK
jgi:hypothetical protein